MKLGHTTGETEDGDGGQTGRFLTFGGERGAPDRDSVHCLYLTPREHTNPLQFFVGEVRLFLVAGVFYVAHSRFLRDPVELLFWHAEQAGSSCLREISWDLIVHNLPLCRRVRLKVSVSSVLVVIKGALSQRGGALSLQLSRLQSDFNRVNHPIQTR